MYTHHINMLQKQNISGLTKFFCKNFENVFELYLEKDFSNHMNLNKWQHDVNNKNNFSVHKKIIF